MVIPTVPFKSPNMMTCPNCGTKLTCVACRYIVASTAYDGTYAVDCIVQCVVCGYEEQSEKISAKIPD